MLKLKDSWCKDIEDEISLYLYDTYFAPIFEITKATLYNSLSELVTAIRSGKIVFKDGEFSGKINVKISGELRKFAKYDKRSKTWKGNPPIEVKAASLSANDKSKRIHEEINNKLNELTELTTSDKMFSINRPAELMDRDIQSELFSLGVQPKINKAMMDKLIKGYNENQNLNIKNWSQKQIQRLRNAVTQSAMTGYRRDKLIALIQNEYKTTKNKAQFLARQETSLFMSKLKMERNLDSGVTKYKWSTSHDVRARDDHKELNGKVFSYSQPPVVDKETGRRANPGEDYNCRCVAIAIID
jgi:SPP1 gp7 family putative phage head morphogenesis protein